MDQASLMQMFPEGSGNRRMENFNPAWYLLENHRETSCVCSFHSFLVKLSKTEVDAICIFGLICIGFWSAYAYRSPNGRRIVFRNPKVLIIRKLSI